MPAKTFPSQSQDRYIIRFPEGMRDLLADVAKMNNRSMNAEIIARLQNSFTESMVDRDIHRDFLMDYLDEMLLKDLDKEEAKEMSKVDAHTVEGMVKLLEIIETYGEKRARLTKMAYEAMSLYQKRKDAGANKSKTQKSTKA